MPAVSGSTLSLKGYRELQRAFALVDRELKRDLDDKLRGLAEPVRADAESLAVGGIRNIGVPWSRMRVGVTSRSVYVAPKQRGSRGRGGKRRPNLADRLMDTAMQPALDRNQEKVVDGVGEFLDELGRDWQRV